MTLSRIRMMTKTALSLLLPALMSACAGDQELELPEEAEELAETEGELVGGTHAQSGDFPSTLFIWANGAACSAARVGADLILTAAHCVVEGNGATMPAYLPGATLRVTNSPSTRYSAFAGSSHTIAQTYPHPVWVQGCSPGTCYPFDEPTAPDVAVIKLTQSLPASIPIAVVDMRRVFPGERTVIMGYGCELGVGVQESADAVDQITLKHRATRTVFPSFLDLIPPYPGQASTAALATSNTFTPGNYLSPSEASLCPGDSGGPMYLDDGGKNRIVGINTYYSFQNGSVISSYNWTVRLDPASRHGVGSWLAGLGVSVVHPTTNDLLTAPIVFDHAQYAALNPDLAAAGITTQAQLRAHWLTAGHLKGRRAHRYFHVQEYANSYPDLSAAFGANWQALTMHFVNGGFNEGRRGRYGLNGLVFDHVQYRAWNPDLVAAGIKTEEQLRDHWLTSGIAEGRRALDGFSVQAYRARYPDLQAVFGLSWAAYIEHFVRFGHAEGRSGAP